MTPAQLILTPESPGPRPWCPFADSDQPGERKGQGCSEAGPSHPSQVLGATVPAGPALLVTRLAVSLERGLPNLEISFQRDGYTLMFGEKLSLRIACNSMFADTKITQQIQEDAADFLRITSLCASMSRPQVSVTNCLTYCWAVTTSQLHCYFNVPCLPEQPHVKHSNDLSTCKAF